MDKKISVLLIDDDPEEIFVHNFRKIIALDKRLEYIGHASSGELGVEMACSRNPDIVVVDLNLAGADDNQEGAVVAREIRLKTGIRVVLATNYFKDDDSVIIAASKKAFASGYFLKSQFRDFASIIYETATSNTPLKALIKGLIRDDFTPAVAEILDAVVGKKQDVLDRIGETLVNRYKTAIFKTLGINPDVPEGKRTEVLIRLYENW